MILFTYLLITFPPLFVVLKPSVADKISVRLTSSFYFILINIKQGHFIYVPKLVHYTNIKQTQINIVSRYQLSQLLPLLKVLRLNMRQAFEAPTST